MARHWLALITDLIDPSRTSVGRVFHKGQDLADGATLHKAHAPLTMMKEGHRKSCPVCGKDNSVIYSGVFFADTAVLDRKVIVNGEGIFVHREDALARGLQPPKGAFAPATVRYRPEWVAKMRLRDPPPA